MSKQLVKILVICALVIICPLVIVGVSLMSTEAVGCTLTIFDGGVEKYGDEDFGGKSSKVTIMVNGEAKKSNKVTLTKRTEVTVTFEGVGYDFLGWFEGKYNEINLEGEKVDKAVSDKLSYTFEISKNTVLTAVRNVKQYNVTYAGFYDDATTVVDIAPETLEFNQPLTMLEAKAGKIQGGWYQEDGEYAGVTTKVANFATSGDVTVYPAWENQMLVEYIKGDKVIASTRLFESQVAEYNLLTIDDQVVKDNITQGYEFVGWTNQLGGAEVTEITYDQNGIKLILNEQLITLSLNVKYNALSEETSTITYNVNSGFSTYNVTRENYTFKGLEYEGNLYEYNATSKDYGTLANVLIEAGVKTADVVAVWDCVFGDIVVNFSASAEYEYNGNTRNWALKGTKNGSEEFVELEDQIITFEDKEGEGYFDINDNAYNYFIGQYTDIKTMNGDAVVYAGTCNVVIDGTAGSYVVSYALENLTFARILTFLGSEIANGTLEGINSISLQFRFQVA